MPIQVICPGCQARYTVPDKFRGKKARCKKCGHGIVVGGPAPAAEVPIEVEPGLAVEPPPSDVLDALPASPPPTKAPFEFGQGVAPTREQSSTGKTERLVVLQVTAAGFSIHRGGRKIDVEAKPIATNTSAGFANGRLSRGGADCLVLRPGMGEYLFAVLLILLGLGGTTGGAIAIAQSAGLQYLAFGVLVLTVGSAWFFYTLFYAPRIAFDRGKGTMTSSGIDRGRPRPLVDVVAVQINLGRALSNIDSQWSSDPLRMEMRYRRIETYEVNLVLDDHRGGVFSVDEQTSAELDFAGMAAVGQYLRESQASSRRLNLTNHNKLRKSRQMARQLAEFLGIPLVDHTA
jgi:hypothetical protein